MTELARKGKGTLKTLITEAEGKSGSTALFGPVRFSHAALFKPRNNKLRKVDEYSVVVLIEKTDVELVKFVRERINHALTKKFGKPLAKFDNCLKDGDTETDKNGEAAYPGFLFISTRADLDQPPVILSPKGIPLDLSDAGGWVSGDWGYAKLDFFGYDNEKKGVSTRMKAVQFAAKGEPFGKPQQSAEEVANEFGGVEGVEEAEGGSFLD